MSRNRLYISGPMSNLPAFNYPAFERAAAHYRSLGHDVLSAHEVPHQEPNGEIGSLPWSEYLRGDLIAMLQHCDRIVMLPGWQSSKGATLERQVALALGFEISYHSEPES